MTDLVERMVEAGLKVNCAEDCTYPACACVTKQSFALQTRGTIVAGLMEIIASGPDDEMVEAAALAAYIEDEGTVQWWNGEPPWRKAKYERPARAALSAGIAVLAQRMKEPALPRPIRRAEAVAALVEVGKETI